MPLVRSRSEASDPNSDRRVPKREVTSLTTVSLHWPTFTGAGAACDGQVPIPMLSATRVERAVLRMLVVRSSKASLPVSYQFRNRTKGVLIARNCAQEGGDVFTHSFRDISGTCRCRGNMTMTFGGRSGLKVLTHWEVPGTVPGYSCSQSGKSYTLEMRHPPSTIR